MRVATTFLLSSAFGVLSAAAAPVAPPSPPPAPPPSPPSPPRAPIVIPTKGVVVLDGNALGGVNFDENSILFCVYPGDEAITDPTQLGISIAPKTKTLIAGMCCTDATDPEESCRRRPTPSGGKCTDEEMESGKCNEYCVAGKSNDAGDITPMTFSQTSYYCEMLGLGMCKQSCRLTGCFYDGHPVWTDAECPFDAPPPSPLRPPPAPPSLPTPTTIGSLGVAIYDGAAPPPFTPPSAPAPPFYVGPPELFCLWPDDGSVTSWPSSQTGKLPIIAAQCCVTGLPSANPDEDCRRRPVNPNPNTDGQPPPDGTNANCVAGPSDPVAGLIKTFTYKELVEYCGNLGITLCGQSCVGKGCQYDKHPVLSHALTYLRFQLNLENERNSLKRQIYI